jgi:hypothetical protein
MEAKAELAKRELSRRSLSRFIHYVFPIYRENWHHTAIIQKLEAVERGEIRKLMITLPPRHGKSEIVSIHFPAWFFGRNPKKSIIASSYSSDLAVTFGRKARNLVNSREYNNVFRTTLAEDSKAAGQWNTNEGGEYTAVGIGGAITGRGADVFIIDDPVKNKDEAASPVIQERNWDWYRSVARTRLTPKGAIVILLTRWDDNDLAGKILQAEAGEWDILNLPAIAEQDEPHRKAGTALWPDQYPITELESIKRELGAELWSALYQQDPVSGDSQVFRRTMFRSRTLEQVSELSTRCFVTIDPAPAKSEKSDFVGVCVNYIDAENFWNLKAYRIKFDPAALINLLFKLYDEERFESVGIEKGMYYDVLKPFLDEEMRKRNIFFTVKELDHGQRSKELRIRGLVPRYEAKQIFHIQGYCADLEEELVRFPHAVHDDVSDAVAYQLQLAEAPAGYNEKSRVAATRRERSESAQDTGL